MWKSNSARVRQLRQAALGSRGFGAARLWRSKAEHDLQVADKISTNLPCHSIHILFSLFDRGLRIDVDMQPASLLQRSPECAIDLVAVRCCY